ncbi:MAG: preprotein translocase subunit Sec61beta [Candidatus Methanomethyliaceae archaeon]|nr:preprotein translocase subunit Sec61beta [Candidatus Methanomethyliaceae archaeon]MDW7971471.1 preprotein translocase subunit Sec61beta [Nitrososphaerota archaeon]
MPKKEKRRAPMPLSGAGLIRFFEEEIHGIKVKPVYVVIASLMLILSVILAHLLTGI